MKWSKLIPKKKRIKIKGVCDSFYENLNSSDCEFSYHKNNLKKKRQSNKMHTMNNKVNSLLSNGVPIRNLPNWET